MGRPKKIISQSILKENNNNDINDSKPITKSKRGRKPTKNIIHNKTSINELLIKNEISNNISCEIKIKDDNENKEMNENGENDENNENDENSENNNLQIIEDKNEKVPLKKRGRKPKGGKIIQQLISTINITETKQNVILHLKCSLKDIKNNLYHNTLNGYNFDNKSELSYDIISNKISNDFNTYESFDNKLVNEDVKNDNNTFDYINNKVDKEFIHDKEDNNDHNNDHSNIKEIWKKIKLLENNLHINNVSDKKSACFWCTYDFDTPCIYIPKHYIKDSYHVYGCFCSPECATSYLMDESIDTSSKFERYYLLNHIYSKIYDYKKNIKPAPNPYYMLDKYYGNLNILEYRALLKSERLFLVVDKPLTRVMPELHEDNDDFIINNKIIPSNTYQIKKKINNKNLTKTSILNEKFGLTT